MKKELEKRLLSSLIIIPLSLFFIIRGGIFFNLFILFCFIITSYEWHMMSKKKMFYLPGIIFLIFSFGSVYELRNSFGEESLSIFLFIIITCVFTDLGGYIFGKIIKGPKLIKISPNKTYSGMIGGYVLSVVSIYIYLKYFEIGFLKYDELNFYVLIFLFLISTMSQIGDIIISYFKRLSKIKDTGKIIPGHGGLLDRVDGMIFAFPFAYLLINMNIF